MKKPISLLMTICLVGLAVPGFAVADAELLAQQRAAAKKGDAEAQFKLGERHLSGKGVNKNRDKAISWYRKAANQGLAKAQAKMGRFEEDKIKSFEWYRKAAAQRFDVEILNLCLSAKVDLHIATIATFWKDEDPNGFIEPKKNAYLWYRIAAEQHPEIKSLIKNRDKYKAQLSAEQIKETNKLAGTWPKAKPKKKAPPSTVTEKGMNLKTLTARAQKGDAKAQFELGERYFKGRGVTKDAKKAASWYQKAADQGLAKAQTKMGNLSDDNKEESMAWYRKAAEQGFDIDPGRIGIIAELDWHLISLEAMFDESKAASAATKKETAYFWFCVAVAQGDDDSIPRLEKIAKKMNAKQIARAKKDCDQWPQVKKKE